MIDIEQLEAATKPLSWVDKLIVDKALSVLEANKLDNAVDLVEGKFAQVPDLAAEVIRLTERLKLADELAGWVSASLKCDAHDWDSDQREYATVALTAYRESDK